MKDIDWRGLSAFVIAVCAAVGLFILTPIVLLIAHFRLGETGGDALIALGGALIGSLATYMGLSLSEGKFTKQGDKESGADGIGSESSGDDLHS